MTLTRVTVLSSTLVIACLTPRPRLGWHLSAVFFALLVCLLPPVASAAAREWTILIFMNGKNDLEGFAIQDFAELAAVGSTNDVSFVVQLGRPVVRLPEHQWLSEVHGGWSGARRFLVRENTTPNLGDELEIVGEGDAVDMGNTSTLEDFLRWGKEAYPAKRYAVIIWNHGQGYRLEHPTRGPAAAGPDDRPTKVATNPASHRAISEDSDKKSIIYNVDLRSAIANVFGSDLDLIGFDACLMATLETAYELRTAAKVMVASEELEPGEGWDYTRIAKRLTGNAAQSERALAQGLVQSYKEAYGDSKNTTLSAIKLDRVEPVARAMSQLSAALLADHETLFPLVRSTRAHRGSYNVAQSPVTIDLIGFLAELEARLELGSEAHEYAKEARDLATGMILYNYTSALRAGVYGSHGVAIYFPQSKAVFRRDRWNAGYLRSNTYKPIEFVHVEGWSTFLSLYLGL